MAKLKVVLIGAGYFSQFHYDAWSRIPEVNLVAVCDTEPLKAEALVSRGGKQKIYSDFREMLQAEKPDVVDIATPPATHREISGFAADEGIHILCQKPLAPSYAEAEELVRYASQAGVRLMVHENFRFQPWHREIKRLLQDGALGDSLHSLSFQMRVGDGWAPDAYLARQPYFRTMPRLLIYETGIHLIDTFRFQAGDIHSVYAHLRKLNPVIAGEDSGLVLFNFESGAVGVFDGNRFNESRYENPRLTFGDFLVEGNKGSLRLYGDGKLTLQPLGEKEREHPYIFEDRNFGGDCVYHTLRHFTDALLTGTPFETDGVDYLKNLQVQEAVYLSSASGEVQKVEEKR